MKSGNYQWLYNNNIKWATKRWTRTSYNMKSNNRNLNRSRCVGTIWTVMKINKDKNDDLDLTPFKSLLPYSFPVIGGFVGWWMGVVGSKVYQALNVEDIPAINNQKINNQKQNSNNSFPIQQKSSCNKEAMLTNYDQVWSKENVEKSNFEELSKKLVHLT